MEAACASRVSRVSRGGMRCDAMRWPTPDQLKRVESDSAQENQDQRKTNHENPVDGKEASLMGRGDDDETVAAVVSGSRSSK